MKYTIECKWCGGVAQRKGLPAIENGISFYGCDNCEHFSFRQEYPSGEEAARMIVEKCRAATRHLTWHYHLDMQFWSLIIYATFEYAGEQIQYSKGIQYTDFMRHLDNGTLDGYLQNSFYGCFTHSIGPKLLTAPKEK